LSVCECDVRVGGALRLAWKSSGETIGSLVETHEFAEKSGGKVLGPARSRYRRPYGRLGEVS